MWLTAMPDRDRVLVVFHRYYASSVTTKIVRSALGAPTAEFFHENGMAVGTPSECLETMKQYKDIGLDQLVTTPGAGWHDPHEMVLGSIRLCGEKIIPELR